MRATHDRATHAQGGLVHHSQQGAPMAYAVHVDADEVNASVQHVNGGSAALHGQV